MLILQLIGIALYYILLQLLLWWLWHTTAVFQSLHAKKINHFKKHTYLHVTFVLLSLTLPVVPVLVVQFVRSKNTVGSIYKSGFTLSRFPPILCTGVDLHVNFWAALFPTSIILAAGVTLLVLNLRVVIKVNNNANKFCIIITSICTETLFVKDVQFEDSF